MYSRLIGPPILRRRGILVRCSRLAGAMRFAYWRPTVLRLAWRANRAEACQAPLKKIFRFTEIRKCIIEGAACPMRGANRESSDIAGQDAVDADSADARLWHAGQVED